MMFQYNNLIKCKISKKAGSELRENKHTQLSSVGQSANFFV